MNDRFFTEDTNHRHFMVYLCGKKCFLPQAAQRKGGHQAMIRVAIVEDSPETGQQLKAMLDAMNS